MTAIKALVVFLPVVCFGQTGASQVFTRGPGTGAVLRSVESKLRETVSVQDYGAKGDGATDDTAAITAAKTYACSLTSASTVNGAKLIFPVTSAFYPVSSTIPLCSYLEIEGYRSKVHYSGASLLFTIPLSVDGSIHGLIMEGAGIANTWAIKVTGTTGNGALNEHIYDNRITGFGDVATHSGGAIWNAADSGQMTINNIFTTTNGTGFLSTAPSDGLDIHDSHMADLNRCMDFTGETGATGISAHNNILVCNSAGRTYGPGGYIFGPANEFESTGAITNASSAAWEFLGDGVAPANIKFFNNPTSFKGDATYGVFVDDSATGPVYSTFCGNNLAGAFPVDPTQFGIYNGDRSGTNTFCSDNHMLQPAANLYKFPQAQGVVYWPLSSNNLIDTGSLMRFSSSSSPTLNDAASGGTGSGNHSIFVIVTKAGISGIVADTFKWNLDGSSFTTDVLMTGSAQSLSAGATVTFGATLGHIVGTTWQIVITSGTVGPAVLTGTAFMQNGDFQWFPTNTGNTLNRLHSGTDANTGWGWRVQNSPATDASSFFETSSSGSVISWVPVSTTALYFPSKFRLGSGAGLAMLSDGPGKTGFAALPVAANNAAAITAGLSIGMFYRTGADPDPVMVVH